MHALPRTTSNNRPCFFFGSRLIKYCSTLPHVPSVARRDGEEEEKEEDARGGRSCGECCRAEQSGTSYGPVLLAVSGARCLGASRLSLRGMLWLVAENTSLTPSARAHVPCRKKRGARRCPRVLFCAGADVRVGSILIQALASPRERSALVSAVEASCQRVAFPNGMPFRTRGIPIDGSIRSSAMLY